MITTSSRLSVKERPLPTIDRETEIREGDRLIFVGGTDTVSELQKNQGLDAGVGKDVRDRHAPAGSLPGGSGGFPLPTD